MVNSKSASSHLPGPEVCNRQTKVCRTWGNIGHHEDDREDEAMMNPRLKSVAMRIVVLVFTLATGIAVSVAWKKVMVPVVIKPHVVHAECIDSAF